MPAATSHLMVAYDRQPVTFTRGAGARLWDENGVEYLDAIAGVAVTSLGHAHPAIAAAIADQARLLLHTSNMYRIEWQERLGQRLCELAGMHSAFFCNSGAEANEAALKLARLHARSKGVSQPTIVVMEGSFHGRTLATLSATGSAAAQQGFEPLMPGFVRVPYNDIDAVTTAARRADGIVAVLVEPVQGEGGVRIASPEYLRQLRAVCDQNDWLLMMDEVQTGMGRTGAWFGFQHSGITPDVITLAKALGNGYPIGACLARGRAAALFAPGHHGSTFGGNPLACRVGWTVVDIMASSDLPRRAAQLGNHLLNRLRDTLADVPGIVDVRGHGMMIGIELDKPHRGLVLKALHQHRLLVSVTRDSTVRLLPPLICDEAQMDEIALRIARLLK